MNIVDYLIIAMLLLFGLMGFKKGFLRSIISLAGFIIVVVIAYYLKNPLATIMYEKLPFFNLKGAFNGVTVLNIIIYEGIAFLIVASVLGLIYRLIISLTNILNKVLDFIVFMGIPSKILGTLFGIIEGFVIAFICLFVAIQINFHTDEINHSKYASKILTSTPLLSSVVGDSYDVFKEIYDLRATYENAADYNKKAFDTLLKHKILSVESAKKLVDLKKINIDGANDIISKYEEEKND